MPRSSVRSRRDSRESHHDRGQSRTARDHSRRSSRYSSEECHRADRDCPPNQSSSQGRGNVRTRKNSMQLFYPPNLNQISSYSKSLSKHSNSSYFERRGKSNYGMTLYNTSDDDESDDKESDDEESESYHLRKARVNFVDHHLGTTFFNFINNEGKSSPGTSVFFWVAPLPSHTHPTPYKWADHKTLCVYRRTY